MKFLFDDAFDEPKGCEWSPRADVYRTPTGWVVKLDLAGVKPADVTVAIRGDLLRVSGVRRDYFVERGYRHHSMEISYSRFERTIQLPLSSQDVSLKTEFVEGMLIVTLEPGHEPGVSPK